jgi:hypothetical protein
MAEKLNITFVKGSREKVFDIERNRWVSRGKVVINGIGNLYWYLSGDNETVRITPKVVRKIRRLLKNAHKQDRVRDERGYYDS